MDLQKGLQKIVGVFEAEEIDYMIVGGFAMSYYNKFRYTADMDIVVQMYPRHVDNILKHFPDWLPFAESFKKSAEQGILFNLTDFETNVRYDFMLYKDSDYSWTAFKRRRKVELTDIKCHISAPEDLIIAKLKWYAMSKSNKQLDDVKFLLENAELNKQYLEIWSKRLNINRYGLF